MIEIKFRFWDSFNEVMVLPTDVNGNKKDLAWFFRQYEEAVKGNNRPVLMQYLNLKINDVEIYAGDIIALYKKNTSEAYFTGVVTDHGYHGFTIDSKNDYMEFDLKSYDYVHLGNKFEHPQLLKK